MSKRRQDEQLSLAPSNAKVEKIPGIKMDVEIGKDVMIRLPDVAHAYRGRVVGYDPYDYIIVSSRLPSKVRSRLKTGGQLTIKYILKGTVFGFRSYALNLVTNPASLLFIEYPSVIEKIELRRRTRLEVNIDASLHTHEGNYECIVINISPAGCKISTRAKARDPLNEAKVDDTMIVAVDFGPEGTLKLPVVVRNLHKEKGIITMGCMFMDILKKEEELIARYLDRVKRLTR